MYGVWCVSYLLREFVIKILENIEECTGTSKLLEKRFLKMSGKSRL